jgi:two-component system chemotaxis response regulator CheB
MEVRLAQDGDWLREGLVLVAPSEAHCTLQRNQRVRLAPGPKVNFVCPSVDVMMQSVKAPPAGQRLIGVLLTGMGKDGAAGLAHLKRLGALTIAQDEASSAVYGMPAEAVKLGCVDHELAPEGILRLLTLKAAR